ncbi:cobalamin (vitamin B12) biosynthesis CbiG protein (plasmid) [Nostoc carneum NIES-2107]|nr:cobalamin (vitamin B12) biosynthesis CbiG protein [Nostoc carneum NIES-2107]
MSDRIPELQRLSQHFWVGLGCQQGVSRKLIETAIEQVLRENQLHQSALTKGFGGAIAGLATINNKASEVGLVEFCQLHNFCLKTYPAEILRLVSVPNPGEMTAQVMGTPSVAEAAAMLAAANIDWQSTIGLQIGENEEQFSTHQSLQLNAHLANLTPYLIDIGVRCLVPKQIFRLNDEPKAVTIAVAALIPPLSENNSGR